MFRPYSSAFIRESHDVAMRIGNTTIVTIGGVGGQFSFLFIFHGIWQFDSCRFEIKWGVCGSEEPVCSWMLLHVPKC